MRAFCCCPTVGICHFTVEMCRFSVEMCCFTVETCCFTAETCHLTVGICHLTVGICHLTGCLRLGRKQTAHKSLHIYTAPNTLTLHLKRFRPDFVKLTGHIAFPLTLNLAPFLSPDSPELIPNSTFCQEPAAYPHQQPAFHQRATGFAQKGHAFREQRVTYRLIGVLVHKGSWSSAGHYFSYVLDSGEIPPVLVDVVKAILAAFLAIITASCSGSVTHML